MPRRSECRRRSRSSTRRSYDRPDPDATRAARVSNASVVLPQRVAPLALGTEAAADTANLRLGVAQRLRTRVHRVVTEKKVVRMRGRRTDHEPGLALGDEIDRVLRAVEDSDLRARNAAGRAQRAIEHRGPGHRVALRGAVGPSLAILQGYSEVRHGMRRN